MRSFVLFDRVGILALRSASAGTITGPVADWVTDYVVVDITRADPSVRINLGRLVDEGLFVEAQGERDRRVVVLSPDVSEADALRAAGPDIDAIAIGPSGWRDLRTGDTQGVSSSWTAASVEAREAAVVLGLPADNLYPLDEDILEAADRVEQSTGSAVCASGARAALMHFKREWAASADARTANWDLAQDAREAEWNSAEQVGRREAIARTHAEQMAAAEQVRLEAEEQRLRKAERDQLRRSKAAEKRTRNKRARLALESAGWPRGWSPTAVRKWEKAGGSAKQAQAWTSNGFSSAEVVQAASISGVGALPELDDVADHYVSLGDSLLDYVTNRLPIPPSGTTISIKSLSPDGSRRRVCIASDETGTIAWEWRSTSGDAAWGDAASWRAADTTAIAATAGSPVWIDTKDMSQVAGLTNDSLKLLSVRGEVARAGPDEWEETEAADWAEDVSYCEDAAERLGAKLLPVSLGSGAALAALDVNGREHYIVLTEGEPLGRRLAESWWSSESEGAPISWDGRDYATQVAPDLLLFHADGDVERDPVLHLLPSTPEGVAQVLAAWTQDIEDEVAAAISLEPLDPHSRLSREARELWRERIDGFTAGVNFDVDPPILDLVRAELQRSSSGEYATVAAALADPDGKGQHLAEALDQNRGTSFVHL